MKPTTADNCYTGKDGSKRGVFSFRGTMARPSGLGKRAKPLTAPPRAKGWLIRSPVSSSRGASTLPKPVTVRMVQHDTNARLWLNGSANAPLMQWFSSSFELLQEVGEQHIIEPISFRLRMP